jgi:hypothetical protein
MVWDPIAGHFISCNINSNLQTVTTAGVFTPGPTLDDSVVGNIDARGLIILPHITSSTSSLNLGTTVQGTASTPQSFDVAGTNLVGDLTITPPTGVVVSLTVSGGFGSSLSLTPTAGAVASTTIFARIQASAPTGAINDFIVLTTTAGDSVDITVTGDVTGPPEIEVSRTGPGTIASGGDDPIAGSVDGVQIDLTYDIDEVGGSDVLFGTPSVTAVGTTGAPGVVIAAGPADASTLTANGNVQLDLEITPSAAGAWVVTVTINSDAATNPYTFTISGTAAATPTPELELSRVGAGVLANGATDTIFGTVDAVMTTLTYDLENIGSATLTFGATSVEVTGSTGTPTVTLVGAPAGSSTMIVGATAAFDVQVTPSAAGAWSATIAINSDGSTGGVHTFTISGTAQATVAPEIAVLRSSTNITNGGTDNAGAATGTAPFVLTYTIRNEGSDVLLLTGGGTLVAAGSPTNCAALVTDPASSSVAAGGGTVTFSVQVTPIATGAFSFTLSIANDDADENPFTFTVNGNTGGTTGGGGGDDDDDSCSTSTGSSWWLVVLGLVGVVAVATRARGSRA